jgi:hypothetical protein
MKTKILQDLMNLSTIIGLLVLLGIICLLLYFILDFILGKYFNKSVQKTIELNSQQKQNQRIKEIDTEVEQQFLATIASLTTYTIDTSPEKFIFSHKIRCDKEELDILKSLYNKHLKKYKLKNNILSYEFRVKDRVEWVITLNFTYILNSVISSQTKVKTKLNKKDLPIPSVPTRFFDPKNL